MNYSDFQQVILWLAGMGSPALVMYILSWVVENWKGWSLLPHNVKFLLPMILSVLLTIGANVLLQYPDVMATIAPGFQLVVTAVFAYLASQKAYLTAMRGGYGKRFSSKSSKRPSVIEVQ